MRLSPRIPVAGLAILVALLWLAGCMPGPMHPMPMGPMGPMHPGMGPMMSGDAPTPVVTPMPTVTPGGSATVSYRRDIQPIFEQRCVSCHGGSAGLWLDSYEHLMAGSTRGPVVVPGDPEASELYRRVAGLSQPAMPLGGPPLSPEEINLIRTWIAEGAPNN